MLNADISIIAPWGEMQYGNVGSFITQGINDQKDVYIIERNAFFNTYVKYS